jgi:hypothetical protein
MLSETSDQTGWHTTTVLRHICMSLPERQREINLAESQLTLLQPPLTA